ncbi:hypothetical protein HPP92_015519 [Vanilla planifolia]|uniref:Uncharacterized protein n=1 Tax=Vanilla planifolia TaxID=51239 RepID=A0A835QLU6_VANPL|nr:hypothetical protein HPP92_015519 [Vanilla planifolia]
MPIGSLLPTVAHNIGLGVDSNLGMLATLNSYNRGAGSVPVMNSEPGSAINHSRTQQPQQQGSDSGGGDGHHTSSSQYSVER